MSQSDKDKAPLPPEVIAALDNLRAVVKRHKVKMTDVTGCPPALALMWEMSDELHRLRRILNYQLPGWDDEI